MAVQIYLTGIHQDLFEACFHAWGTNIFPAVDSGVTQWLTISAGLTLHHRSPTIQACAGFPPPRQLSHLMTPILACKEERFRFLGNYDISPPLARFPFLVAAVHVSVLLAVKCNNSVLLIRCATGRLQAA
jgi:hypothetical protein